MKKTFLLILSLFWLGSAYAVSVPFTCIGKKGIEAKQCECRSMKGKAQVLCNKQLDSMIELEEAKIAKQKAQINSGVGSGAGNTNVILGGLGLGGGNSDSLEGQGLSSLVGIKSNHYIGIGMAMYFLPSEPGYKRQMPARFFPNHLEYHYYINPNWSAGVMWQDYTLKGSLFSPVTEKRMVDEEVIIVDPVTGAETTEIRSVEKDVVVRQPGSNEMKIQRLWGIMAFHVDIAREVELEVLGGYSLIYDVLYTTEGYEDEKFSPPKPFMMAIAAGYKPVDKDYIITAGFRFVDSPTEAPDMLDYKSPGGAEIYAGVRFGVF